MTHPIPPVHDPRSADGWFRRRQSGDVSYVADRPGSRLWADVVETVVRMVSPRRISHDFAGTCPTDARSLQGGPRIAHLTEAGGGRWGEKSQDAALSDARPLFRPSRVVDVADR